MPRFVILTHDWPTLHWDLMLEKVASLRTWRLARPADAAGPIDALPLPDHRLAYLEYEGPLSGDRGTVLRWDSGDYRLVGESPDRIEVELTGRKIIGRFALRQNESGDRWTFHCVEVAGSDESPGADRS